MQLMHLGIIDKKKIPFNIISIVVQGYKVYQN